jgi:serine/threonine protein kinase
MVITELLAGGTLAKWVGNLGAPAGGLLGRALRAEKAGITYREYVGVNQYIENEIVKALKHMHERGFGHFDIKPENVMFDSDFNVKVIDLGGATRFRTAGPLPTTTTSWWSPEWAASADKSSAVTEAYDAYGMGLWSNKALSEVRGLKDPKHGPPAPGAGNQQGPQLASEQYVGAATSTDPSRRTIAELAERAYLVDPLIDADEARAVLRFVNEWTSNNTLSYRAAPSPREEVPEPDPDAPMPARTPLPFIGQLLERAMARGEVELQAQVPQAVLETVGSTQEEERPPV